MKSFEKFEDTTKALASAASLIEGKMSKDLKGYRYRKLPDGMTRDHDDDDVNANA